MRSMGFALHRFKLEVFDAYSSLLDSCSLPVLFCDRFSVCTDIDNFLRENFLCSLSTRRVPARANHILYFYANDRESIEASVAYVVRDVFAKLHYGHLILNAGEEARISDIYSVTIRPHELLAHAAETFDLYDFELSLLSFTVTSSNRSVTFFVDNSLQEMDYFVFHNCFNLPEYAYLPFSTTAKTEVDRSTAIINGNMQFYDQAVTKSYQTEVSALTEAESAWIDQLFTSHEVLRPVLNPCDDQEPIIYMPVLLTDSTCEISDNSEQLNSAKFTWRFANSRPLTHLSASTGIFTSPFNPPFS